MDIFKSNDENTKTSNIADASAFFKPLSEREQAAMNLRALMARLDIDKCMLCNAARELEKKEEPGNSMWPMLALAMLAFMPMGGGADTTALINAITEAMKKVNDEKENSEKAD